MSDDRNGLRSAQSSYAMQPMLHTSDFQSYPLPYRTSGLMYRGVPTREKASKVYELSWRLSPKSPTLRSPSLSMNIFAGFKSRCIILFVCICYNAPAIWCMYFQIYFSGKETSSSCALFMTNLRSPFSAHSTAIKSSFSLLSINQLRYLTILG